MAEPNQKAGSPSNSGAVRARKFTFKHHFKSSEPDKQKSPAQIEIESLLTRLLRVGQQGGRMTTTIVEKELLRMCAFTKAVFKEQPALIEIDVPVVMVGDIHGQYGDLLRIFNSNGFPPEANYIFLGDYVDRGSKNLETISILFCYKILYPEHFFLLRGNHECSNVNRVYGFYEECNRRYKSVKLWQYFQDVFNWIPLVGVVGSRIICMHGGLSPELKSLDQLRQLQRPKMPTPPSLEIDLLWADPNKDHKGWQVNTRGVSQTFGEDIVKEFCQALDLDMIVRAHQVVQDGYEFFADRKLVTVFSAPHYCGQFDNNAATLSINENLQCNFSVYKPTCKAIRMAIAKMTELQLQTSSESWPKKDQAPMGPCDGTTSKD